MVSPRGGGGSQGADLVRTQGGGEASYDWRVPAEGSKSKHRLNQHKMEAWDTVAVSQNVSEGPFCEERFVLV